jgi:hypothetical protein
VRFHVATGLATIEVEAASLTDLAEQAESMENRLRVGGVWFVRFVDVDGETGREVLFNPALIECIEPVVEALHTVKGDGS